ncbi:MAG: inositol monophosphatase family protein [Gemmatimonadaceae bacterium]
MTASNSQLLAGVTEAARAAGRVALSYYRQNVRVETKRDGSPVTVADREAERAARDWIARHFPGDQLLGEELGYTPGANRRWFIDPIDGTRTFVRGVPLWGSMIAVAEGDPVLAGAIYCPAVDELVAAALGEGAFLNGAPCRVSDVDRLEDATILTTDERFRYNPHRIGRWMPLTQLAAVSRSWGDCYGYVLIATGRAEVMVDDRLSPWDAAALIPIITEAGGVYSDWRGGVSVDGGDAIATNARLSPLIRKLLISGEPHAPAPAPA